MNPVRLANLINDTIEGIDRSRLGSIYFKDKEGNVVKDGNGLPMFNTITVQVFQIALQAQIMKASIYED